MQLHLEQSKEIIHIQTVRERKGRNKDNENAFDLKAHWLLSVDWFQLSLDINPSEILSEKIVVKTQRTTVVNSIATTEMSPIRTKSLAD